MHSTREFPDPEIELVSPMSLVLAGGFFTTNITQEALKTCVGASISLLGGDQQAGPGASSESQGATLMMTMIPTLTPPQPYHPKHFNLNPNSNPNPKQT